MRICVFCSSSGAVDQAYVHATVEFGRLLGEHGHSLVFGGSCVGLMGELARAAQAAPPKGHASSPVDGRPAWATKAAESCITATWPSAGADGARGRTFVALPGGFGTLEEIASITLKQCAISGPVAL